MPAGAFYGQEGGRRLRRGVVQNAVVERVPHDPTGSQARHLLYAVQECPKIRGGLKALGFCCFGREYQG